MAATSVLIFYSTFSIFTIIAAKEDSAEATKSGCNTSLLTVTEVIYRAENYGIDGYNEEYALENV